VTSPGVGDRYLCRGGDGVRRAMADGGRPGLGAPAAWCGKGVMFITIENETDLGRALGGRDQSTAFSAIRSFGGGGLSLQWRMQAEPFRQA
jgi:hypothetical protein